MEKKVNNSQVNLKTYQVSYVTQQEPLKSHQERQEDQKPHLDVSDELYSDVLG